MRPVHNWHHSRWGRTARFLGSVNLAVPVMVFVAAALAWGTYLESAQNVKVARATVYGSWWFIGLMGLVCVTLVFAVVTRYPWKRKHIGFMTVHAGLILLIIGGFWSMFGRVEGQLPLEAGTESNLLVTDSEQVELVRHQNGEFQPVATAPLEVGGKTLNLRGTQLDVVGRWANCRQEAFVADDAPEPYRAVEVAVDPQPGESRGMWVGEESHASSTASDKNVRIRVLPPGEEFVQGKGPVGGFVFVAGAKETALMNEGQEVAPGWKVETIRRFEHAMVTATGLEEAKGGEDNPAVEVAISDGNGSREQHRAFTNFPDMVMGKPLSGANRSNLKLVARADVATAVETVAIWGTPPALKVTYVGSDGAAQQFEQASLDAPWTLKAGARTVTIFHQYTHARAKSRLVEAPKGPQNRPALLVSLPGQRADAAIPLVWRAPTPLPIEVPDNQDPIMVRFGPRTVTLPFTIQLKEFRKRDYPGTEMAMSYESDVAVTMPDGSVRGQTISMNEPFKGEGWKVYQSGFMGADVSIFSIMHDPGLPLTYIGCITLCIGITLTFYSRALSGGHPGIPALFGGTARKENGHDRVDSQVNPPVGVSVGDAAPERLARAGAAEPELVSAGR